MKIIKTKKDAEIFFNELINPKPPNTALINAAKNFKEWLKNKSKI